VTIPPRSPDRAPRAVVFGYHTMGCLGFEALLHHGFEIAAVLTHHDSPGEEVWWGSLAALARERSVEVLFPTTLKDPALEEVLTSLAPDFIFSFYYRHMIPVRLLQRAPRGAYNLHGSLLPHYRGRAPVNWVLVNGERETGVSLHRMVGAADAGDLVDTERVAIAGEDTAFSLFTKLEKAAARLLDRALPALRDGTAVERPQDLASGSYFGGRRPEDGRIDWAWPARRVYDLVRAVTHPYPGAFTTIGDRKLMVWWALPIETAHAAAPGTVLASSREGITVAAGEGAVRLVTVQLEGQPELPACTFALTAGLDPGTTLGPYQTERKGLHPHSSGESS